MTENYCGYKPKIKSTRDWEKDRPEQYKLAKDIIEALEKEEVNRNSNGNSHREIIGVTAPVKSGKREIKEIIATIQNNKEKYKYYYYTSLDRLDTIPQKDELNNCGIEVIKYLKEHKTFFNLIKESSNKYKEKKTCNIF